MSTEIYVYSGQECQDYVSIAPGDYRTILNINSDGQEELIVAHCRGDNKCSVLYTIHPREIIENGESKFVKYDRKETENRSDVIWPGGERIINTRERMPGSKRIAIVRYRFSHR